MTRKTFLDILGQHLSALPDAARMAIALDPRRMLDISSPFLDDKNREWKVFIYDRNDLHFRNILPSYQKEDKRLIIVGLGSADKISSDYSVDLSFIPDIIEESTAIIDCSPSGLLYSLVKGPLPSDVYEEPLLSLWANDIGGFGRNLIKYQKLSGKGSVLNRFDAMAISLATSANTISLEELANLPAEPISRLAFYLRTVAEHDLNDAELTVLQKIILGPNPAENLETWCTIERSSLLRYLYFGLAVIRYAVPNGLAEIQHIGLLDFDASKMGGSVEKVLNALRKDLQFQQAVTIAVQESNTLMDDINKLAAYFKFGSFEDGLKAFSEEPSPAIGCSVGRLLLEWIIPSKEGRVALREWNGQVSLFRDSYPKTPFTQKARYFRELFEHLSWLELTTAKATEPPPDLLSIINTYRKANLHALEFKEADAQDLIRLLKDKQVNDCLKPHMDQIRIRINEILGSYDKTLGKNISSNFSAYTHFQRLNTQILRNLIQAGAPRKERIWIIILDGMRLDTWDCVIWPRMRELFETDGEEQLYLSTLPSFTDISRVAFLAGKLPPHWKDYFNNFTEDHNILLSRHLDLGKDEGKKKLKILARMEEKTEHPEVDFGKAQFRCLIFNISDTWIHHEQGNLVRVNEIIREKFEKMVFPELSSLVETGDIVVVTSDHGFMELRKDKAIQVNEPKSGSGWTVDDIKYRYIQNGRTEMGMEVVYDKNKRWWVAVGSEWFERPKAGGKVPRYSHGGISMAEMVIPAVRLKKRAEKKVELTLKVEPPDASSPGDTVKLPVQILNQGSTETNVTLTCRVGGRLVAEDFMVLPPGTTYNWSVSIKADPKANQVLFSAQYILPGKEKKTEKRMVTIPIKELGTKVEIDTSALDVFKDL